MNIYEPNIALRLSLAQVNTLVTALAYVKHPSFDELRLGILSQIEQQGVSL